MRLALYPNDVKKNRIKCEFENTNFMIVMKFINTLN